ncbi:MAG: MATE family efflux transporter [Planctomycetes bacterium]|nr:MATE family efflux transporter [Planctomycetota bacterium]
MADRQVPLQVDSLARGVRPLYEVWAIAWPIVVTMTSYTVMQFVDKLMVAQVGPLQVAAQGNGGIWAFAPIGFVLGALTVVNTYVSQNLGAGTPGNGPKYAWAAMWLSVGAWVLLLLPWAACLPWLFSSMGHGDELLRLETGYGQILLLGAVLLLASRGLNHYFFGLHRPRIVTVAAIVGNIVNGVANYVLIFGSEGFPAWGLPGVPGVPAMGLFGAAVGTIIGTAVELAIPLAVFLGPKMHRELGSRRPWRIQLSPIRDVLKLGWPAAVQFGNEIVCWSIFMSVLVGMFGEAHMTAGWIALGYMHLSFMPAIGFSVAVSSLVGKYIGAGQPDIAVARARLGLALAVVYMSICGLLFFVFRHQLIGFFVAGKDLSPDQAQEIITIGGKLMICAAVFQTVDAFGITYTGALRGAGDTVWPGIVTIIFSWLFIVAGGWLMIVTWPQLGSIGPWIAASAYIIIYGITMSWRFETGRWRSIKLLEPRARDAAQVAPIGPGPPATDPDAAVRDLAESMVDPAAPDSATE